MGNRTHRQRINQELKAAGMTGYGFMKMATAQLPKYIHEDEHIGGIIYGRTTGEKIGTAMMVATNKRIVFIDSKPLFTSTDEISYDVVAGIKMSKAGAFSSITLHTRIQEYSFRYVNTRCARLFVKFIEDHIELHENGDTKIKNEVWKSSEREHGKEEIAMAPHTDQSLLQRQHIAVLSTVDREDMVHGSVVHYVVGDHDELFFATRTDSTKAHNIQFHPQVALTVYDPSGMETVQIAGVAEEVTDPYLFEDIFDQISSARYMRKGVRLPPSVSHKSKENTIFRVSPMSINYKDQGGPS